jgi:hypothetical protein
MSRKRRASLNVEGLEGRAVLSGIAPSGIAPSGIVGPPPRLGHLVGSASGTCVTTTGTTATPTSSSIHLQGSGVVSPLGTVSLTGTITASGGQLTLRCADKVAAERVILSAPHVVASGPDVTETFSYTTADGAYAGTFTLDLHDTTSSGSSPSQLGTFYATFS